MGYDDRSWAQYGWHGTQRGRSPDPGNRPQVIVAPYTRGLNAYHTDRNPYPAGSRDHHEFAAGQANARRL